MIDEDKVKAVYILDWLVKKCCQMNETYDTVNPFKCYSLNKLFYELRRHADLNNPSLMFASPALVADHFGKGMFYYSKNMACQVITFTHLFIEKHSKGSLFRYSLSSGTWTKTMLRFVRWHVWKIMPTRFRTCVAKTTIFPYCRIATALPMLLMIIATLFCLRWLKRKNQRWWMLALIY